MPAALEANHHVARRYRLAVAAGDQLDRPPKLHYQEERGRVVEIHQAVGQGGDLFDIFVRLGMGHHDRPSLDFVDRGRRNQLVVDAQLALVEGTIEKLGHDA